MPPDYLAVLAASYDYEAQSEDEISITEGQLLLLLEKVDDEWWKVKIKAAQETESPVGLVPAAYVEQAEHTSVVRTLYDYEATAPGELSVTEEELLWVFETDDDWLLVQHSTDPKAGYVPGNYVEVVDESAPAPAPAAAAPRIVVPDSPPRPVAPYVDPADRVAQSRAAPAAAADEIKTWAVSEIDKKGKKKKGTLGVGNGNVYFASESDKTPVQKWQTKDLGSVVSEKAKHVRVDIAGTAPTSLHFHAGSKDHAEAIIAKLELSKSLASPPASASAPRNSPPPTEVSKKASVHFSSAEPVIIPEPEEEEEEEEEEEVEEEPQPEPVPRQVSTYAPPPRAPPRAVPAPVAAPEPEEDGEEEALALYDFTADGEDELSVTEGERLVVLEKDGDEWWKCRNASGGEGVVPASYLESVPGTKASAPKAKATSSAAPGAAAAAAAARAAEARRAQEEADAAAEAEAEAEREREKAQEAAAEARRQRARKAEAQEKAKQSALAAEAQRQQRVEARASSPPVAQQSSRSKDPRTSSAAGSTASKTSSEINRPPPEKTRVWHDRSGQFRVDAAFLGFNNGKLRLHKVNGVIVEVPSEKMSLEDMRYVERFLEKNNRARPGSSGAPRISEDDIPLGLGRNSSSADGASRAARTAQQEPPKKKAPTIDWFDFFLSAGCDLDDCTRYAAAFERDKLDEALLADITEGTMRSLGLREGDILRVKKAVARRAPGENLAKPSAREEEQLRRDEELARQLQAQEGGAGAGKPPPHLFADAQGVLKPRRGRRAGTASVPANVDIKAIAGASDQIQRTASPMSTQSPGGARTATPVLPARPPSAAAAPLISGFEDDAWTNRPSSTKPVKAMSPPPAAPPVAAPAPALQPAPVPTPTVAPTPPAPTPSAPPSLANTTESDIFEQLAKLSVLRQTQHSAPPRPAPPAAAPSPAFAPPVPARFPTGVGMGVGPSPVPMGQLSPPPQQPYNGPRGPFAPVPANQSLLQPLIPLPTQPTGLFIPTKAPTMNGGGGASPFGSGSMLAQPAFLNSQPTGFIPQQQQQLMSQPTGFGHFTPSPQPMMGQPTGFNPGMQQQPIMAQQTGAYGAFGGSPFGNPNQGQNGSGFNPAPLQSQMTGFRPPLNQSMFGPGPASPPPVPPLPSHAGHNTSPANVFASMKSGTFANDNDNQSNTGLNGQTPVWGQTYQGYTGY